MIKIIQEINDWEDLRQYMLDKSHCGGADRVNDLETIEPLSKRRDAWRKVYDYIDGLYWDAPASYNSLNEEFWFNDELINMIQELSAND